MADSRYRLTELAAEDLRQIAAFSLERFGVEQAARYRDSLKEQLERIAEHPQRYPSVEHIRKGYRRAVCGVHSIYYTLDGELPVIVRVLGRQDPFFALG